MNRWSGRPHIPTNLPREEREVIAARHGYTLDEAGNIVPAIPPYEAPRSPTLEEERSDWRAQYGCTCPVCVEAFIAGGVVAADAALAFEGEVGSVMPIIAGGCAGLDRYGDSSGTALQSERLAIEIVRAAHNRRAAIRHLFDVAPEVKPGIGAKGARTGARG